jgi:5-dehydro-2-deoxygluconokinase
VTYDLITVGRANMDLYSTDIGAPFEKVRHFEAMVGGSPTNIAIATARLGLTTIAFTGVGEDRVGDFIVDYLRGEGVVTDHVARIPGKLSSLALLGVEPPSRFPLLFYREDPADIHLTVGQAANLPLDSTSALQLSGNAFSRGSCAEAAAWLGFEAQRNGLTVFMDLDLRPSDWATPAAFGTTLRPNLANVDVVIGTEEELMAALAADPEHVMTGGRVGVEDVARLDGLVAEVVAREGLPDAVVVKRGPRGASLFGADGVVDVPGFGVDVVNTVGAGDAFASGLITRRLRGDDWYRALRYANACGAIEVTRHGCSAAFPRPEEVATFMEEHDAT